MNVSHAQDLAEQLIAKHLHHPTHPWKFRWNKRKRSAGLCSYGRRTIELSIVLTSYASEEEVRDTILHEIAHGLTPGHHHDYVWQAKAKEIGADGKRCYSEETKPEMALAHKEISKYKAVCKNGHEHYKNKMSRRNHSCGQCSRTFNPNEILVWTLNR